MRHLHIFRLPILCIIFSARGKTKVEYLPDHLLICRNHQLDPRPIALWGDVREEAVSGDPARAAAEYVNAINAEEE
jgi:hypothetical protein